MDISGAHAREPIMPSAKGLWYGRFGHLSTKIDENTNSNYSFNFQYVKILSDQTLENSHSDQTDFHILGNWMSKTIKCVKSFWLDCELNKFDVSSLTPELTFSDQNKIDLKFSRSNFVWNLCFLTLNIPHIPILLNKTQNRQYLHVKHQNTRKTP